ncbi:MAG TPA: tetratricopeptide repeat protein [Candidatus Hydrogenedentes bacterium]|nr:tetratricopeptide repeat protein [Candidatus Hydrogenedentota bacterium]
MAFGGDNAESYYDEGLTASMRGDLARAVQCLEQAIHLDRSFVPAFHLLAKCYMRMGHGERAARILDSVVRERPDQTAARLNLAAALLAMGDIERAEHHFTQIATADPANGRALLGLSRVRMQQGNWRGAVNMAQAAERCAGPGIAVLLTLGRAAKPAGDLELATKALEEADALLEKSVELNPDQPEGYYLRGEVNFLMDKLGTALEHFRRAENRAERGKTYTAFGETFFYVDVLAKQGLCLQRLGRNGPAKEIGIRIAEIDPGHKIGQALRDL